jgi:hypothetical protein
MSRKIFGIAYYEKWHLAELVACTGGKIKKSKRRERERGEKI